MRDAEPHILVLEIWSYLLHHELFCNKKHVDDFQLNEERILLVAHQHSYLYFLMEKIEIKCMQSDKNTPRCIIYNHAFFYN